MTLRKKDPHRPPDDALWFLPLGGSGEIGMNLNLYGTAGKWLMVDCGITFPDESTPGIEVIMPDISFIAERSADLVGIVITHGHEDHIGAIEHFWPRLKCPIYATRFTAEMIRAKLAQAGLNGQARVLEIPSGGTFEIGPFRGEMVHVTHSVPDSHMLFLSTANGKILHTGDWKLDPDPVVGTLTDEDRLREIGKEGVDVLVGDSTASMIPGHSGSERSVQKCFNDIFGRYRKRIIVTCFSSNTARLKSIAAAARAHGRYVALAGRSLWRNAEIAESCGYLPEFNEFLSEHEAMTSPRDKIVLVCTGCQGEPRAALSRMASFDHPEVELDEGDAVIFSSREIPGNEKAIGRVQNLLIRQGIQVVTSDHAPVHVSGHCSRDEMETLYAWIKPKLAVPVHGELRHQTEHANLAKACGVPAAIIPENGKIIRLGPGIHETVGEVQSGRLGMDGRVLRALNLEAIKNRRKMGFNGAVVATLAIDRKGNVLGEPQITMLGVEDEQYISSLRVGMSDEILAALEEMPKSSRLDDAAVKNRVTQAMRRFLKETHGKKPMLDVHLMRV